jgi:hypothetical protein
MHFSIHKASATLTVCFITKLGKFGSISQTARLNENYSVQPNTVESLAKWGNLYTLMMRLRHCRIYMHRVE